MNLWENLDKISAKIQNSSIKILMLDFDGTLAPIAETPSAAKLPTKTKNLLIKLSRKERFYLTIISGRSLPDLKNKISLENIIYSGNHGLEGEIFREKYSFPVPTKMLSALKTIKAQLDQIAGQFKGVLIEDKGSVLSFHYRLAGKQIPKVKLAFREVVSPYIQENLISILSGNMVFGIRPKVNWNKGNFAELVINTIQRRTKITPAALFVGDDTTDEDIFQKLEKEITVKVNKDKYSKAKYRLNDTRDVYKFLDWINYNC